MKKNLISIFIVFLYVSISFAQSNLNAYKYIIVPKKYDFLKQDDRYHLNSLTKFLFEKQGFTTYLEGESLPNDLLNNPCLGLNAQIQNNSSIFKSKLIITLTNCRKEIVLTSVEGKSKEKDYEKSYQEALRNAFVSFQDLNYNFDENLVINKQFNAPTSTNANVIVKAKPEKIATSSVVAAPPVVTPPTVIKEPETAIKAKELEKSSIAKSYKNEQISFFLIEQNKNLVAYVKESKIEAYKVGEKIGTLFKTSRPNSYRITWKGKDGNTHETTGYFDEDGNLKVDIEKEGKIQVVLYKVEK